ncbi:MAG: metallophosphoesterase [Candidatus Aenigmarchaeota archaeon]|nr:metallophosphoesterase [Candidatus Aenigmarchaeota archaeon]
MAFRFLVIGDLHGQVPKIGVKNFDAVLAPGDFCSDPMRKYEWISYRKSLKEGREISWVEITGVKKAKGLIKKSFADGRRVLKKLNSLGKPVFIVRGNWDHEYSKLIKGLKNLRDISFESKTFMGYTLIGYPVWGGAISTAPEGPAEFVLAYSQLKGLFEKAKGHVIFLSHNVPYNTKLDKVLDKRSPAYGKHAGSILVRKAIEWNKPLVSVGGHIHEHFGKIKIKGAVALNAGFGSHVNTLIELDGKKINSIKFLGKNMR